MTVIPASLFHYTTQQGVIGIVSNKRLWASKIHYLNDATEFRLAFDICSNHLQALLKGERSTKRRTKIKTLLSNLREIASLNLCVAALSENGDLLSQWRAYTGPSSGFSIQFNSAKLGKLGKTAGYRLVKCVYDPKLHVELIESLVADSLEVEFNTKEATVTMTGANSLAITVTPTGGDFSMKFAQLAAELKSPAFSEEAEWRLLSEAGISVMEMSFRPGLSMIIPYAAISLGDEKTGLFESVTIGPTPHPELAENSVRSLLAQQNFARQVHVKQSGVPHRAW